MGKERFRRKVGCVGESSIGAKGETVFVIEREKKKMGHTKRRGKKQE